MESSAGILIQTCKFDRLVHGFLVTDNINMHFPLRDRVTQGRGRRRVKGEAKGTGGAKGVTNNFKIVSRITLHNTLTNRKRN